jgi:HlyD family secretion protein
MLLWSCTPNLTPRPRQEAAIEQPAREPPAATAPNRPLRHWLRQPGLWIAVAAILAGLAFGAVKVRGPRVTTVFAVRRDLEQRLVASGYVWVPTRVQVAAQTTGRVLVVAVQEGQRVSKGDVLIELDDAEARAAVSQARAAVAEAGARVEQTQSVGSVVATEQVNQMRTNRERARADLTRTEQLAAIGGVAMVDLDEARRLLELAEAQLAAAEARQLAAAPRGADSRLVVSSLQQYRAQLDAARVRLAHMTVVAPQDAIVLNRAVEPGNIVQPSQTLLVMAASTDTAQIVFESDERNLAAIQVGQRARVSADAYPQQVFDAYVGYLAPSIDPERGSIEVRLRVPASPAFLKPDMTVSVDLAVAAKAQALTVPSEAVRGASSGAPWLFAVDAGRLLRRDVTLGLRGEGTVEILSGVDEGAEVVLPDERRLTAGQRVRSAPREP